MSASRTLYLTFYILALIILALAFWFMLYFTNVPMWIWSLFATAFIVFIIGALIKEYIILAPNCGEYVSFWWIMYIILHVMAFILIIVGIALAAQYSTMSWWIWTLLSVGVIMWVIASMILTATSYVVPLIVAIIGFILFVTGLIIAIVQYTSVYWWVWFVTGIALTLAVLSMIFEITSRPAELIITYA